MWQPSRWTGVLKIVFKQNGSSDQQIHYAINPPPNTLRSDQKPISVALLPFTQTIHGWLNRMLSKYTIKYVGLPPKKTSNLLCQVKDDFGLKTPGIYTIHCKCELYIGQTSCPTETRIEGHWPHIQLAQPEKSKVAEHIFPQYHAIQLYDTKILSTKSDMDPLIIEAIK